MTDTAAGPAAAWSGGVATGVGSLPGVDPTEAVRTVLRELPHLPHLPELPARGPGADMIGRAVCFLPDLHVDLQPAGWRLVARPGVEERRALDLLARDLDALEQVAGDHDGPVKLQVVGPWTLAASVELTRGDKALADHAAVRDLAAALAEGVAGHVTDVRRRLPRASVVLQVDEPSLPAVLSARVPTASGFGALRAVHPPAATERLGEVLAAAGTAGAVPVVHCCAAEPPVALLVAAGAAGLSLDARTLTAGRDEALGGAVEAGVRLLLGLVPAVDTELSDLATTLAPVRSLWRRLGFPAEQLPATVTVTPTCGLAAASPAYARAAMGRCREAARVLAEAPDLGAGRGRT